MYTAEQQMSSQAYATDQGIHFLPTDYAVP